LASIENLWLKQVSRSGFHMPKLFQIPPKWDILIEALCNVQNIRISHNVDEEFLGEGNLQPIEKGHSLLTQTTEERQGSYN
jgi:hypothetical protein